MVGNIMILKLKVLTWISCDLIFHNRVTLYYKQFISHGSHTFLNTCTFIHIPFTNERICMFKHKQCHMYLKAMKLFCLTSKQGVRRHGYGTYHIMSIIEVSFWTKGWPCNVFYIRFWQQDWKHSCFGQNHKTMATFVRVPNEQLADFIMRVLVH